MSSLFRKPNVKIDDHAQKKFAVAVCSGGIARLGLETQNGQLHVVPVEHSDIAWDIVLRHLRSFDGETLLFVFLDSQTYDAGVAELRYSKHIRTFGPDGEECRRLSAAERRRIRERVAALQDRPLPSKFYSLPGIERDDALWIFGVVTPARKALRVAVWNGRRNYAHEIPKDLLSSVGGDRIALVQVDKPVGTKGRSSLDLTHKLSQDFYGIIHWARETATYQSIIASFVRLDIQSVRPATVAEDWEPELVIFSANPDAAG